MDSYTHVPLWRGPLAEYTPQACLGAAWSLSYTLPEPLREVLRAYRPAPGETWQLPRVHCADLLGGTLRLSLELTGFVGHLQRKYPLVTLEVPFTELPDTVLTFNHVELGPQSVAQLLGSVLPSTRQMHRQRRRQYTQPLTAHSTLGAHVAVTHVQLDTL